VSGSGPLGSRPFLSPLFTKPRRRSVLRTSPARTLQYLSDPCIIILRRPDETVVARFSPFADPMEIRRAAEEDRARVESEPDG
jgi:hypothetical protein